MAAKFEIENDGTPNGTTVVATFRGHDPIDITDACCRIVKHADSPRIDVQLVGGESNLPVEEAFRVELIGAPLIEAD